MSISPETDEPISFGTLDPYDEDDFANRHLLLTHTYGGTLREEVSRALRIYFNQLDGHTVSDLYEIVLKEVEVPLLEAVMKYTGFNQCKASELLGMNRGTLRKKLKKYGLTKPAVSK